MISCGLSLSLGLHLSQGLGSNRPACANWMFARSCKHPIGLQCLPSLSVLQQPVSDANKPTPSDTREFFTAGMRACGADGISVFLSCVQILITVISASVFNNQSHVHCSYALSRRQTASHVTGNDCLGQRSD